MDTNISGLVSWVPTLTNDGVGPIEIRYGRYDSVYDPAPERVRIEATLAEVNREMSCRVSEALFAIDRNSEIALWPTTPPMRRSFFAWFNDAMERCLNAVGLCRISRVYEHAGDE